MAGPRKKRTVEKPGAESSDQEEPMDEVVEADFEGRNPEATDFHGIQQLLKQLFLKAHINTSELSDMIINQQGVGSVLKQSSGSDDEDEEEDDSSVTDVFGITTVVNLTAQKNSECVQQLLENLNDLVKTHADKETQEKIMQILSDGSKKLGLIINERIINIPAKISDPLFGSLLGEVERIAIKNQSYRFDYFIMICKTYKTTGKNNTEGESVFINAEEEIFAKANDCSFEFSVAKETDTGVGGLWTEDDAQMTPHRRVLIISADKFPNIVHNVKQFVA